MKTYVQNVWYWLPPKMGISIQANIGRTLQRLLDSSPVIQVCGMTERRRECRMQRLPKDSFENHTVYSCTKLSSSTVCTITITHKMLAFFPDILPIRKKAE